jgi:stearoyl-CoA desaturase (delta-9 desaturase)
MNRYFYIAFLPLHVFLLAALYNFEEINLGWCFVFWILLSGYGVGVTLHRLLSHRAFETSEFITKILSLISCFCIQGSPIFWVNIHRGWHHRHSDTEKDIHSPVNGKLNSYFMWACTIDANSISYKFVPDLLRSNFQLFLSKYYFYIIWAGWVVAWTISPMIFYSLIIAQIITMHLEFCVNLFCHANIIPGGYRNFDTKDNSRNYWLFGLLCWGIGYHNNHHARPKEISFGYTKFEFDPTTLLVKLIQKN